MDTISKDDLARRAGPKYIGLAEAIRGAVGAGRLAAGEKLPPVRDLAHRLGVTPGTVARAYQRLTDSGLLQARVGRGTFVATRAPATPAAAAAIDLRRSFAADVGQAGAIRKALIRAAECPEDELLDYPTRVAGVALREALVAYLAGFDLGAFSADDIALGHGAQHAYILVLQAVLRGAAPKVAMEEVSYPGFRHGARLLRAQTVTVQSDAEGPVPASLAAACDAGGVQVFVTSPFAQNPTTLRTSRARRHEIAALARARDIQIIEDETFAQPEPEMPNYRALAPERTWYVGSLAKNFSPALRLGFVVAAAGRADEAVRAAQDTSFGLSIPIKTVTTDLLTRGTAAQVRADIRAVATERGRALAAALEGYALTWREGVPFAYLDLPSGWRASGFTRAAEAAGVVLRPAEDYVPVDARAPNAVRIALNGRVPMPRFEAAAATLRGLLDAPPTGSEA